MNHTPKIIEKIGLEIHDIYLNCKKSPRGTPFLSKKEGIKFRELLYQIHTQAKEEERERIGEEILKEKRWVWNAPMKEMADCLAEKVAQISSNNKK